MSLQHRFKIGDTVKVVKAGLGINPDHIGKIATITSLGYYTEQVVFNDYRDLGYTTYPSFGPGFSGFYSEGSFKLLKSKQIITHTKTKQMSKSRQVVKKVAQDVRVIETSLINKEEVFKMLALAESTGLPCLLVGAPGVAKTKTVIEYAKAWLNKDGKMTAEDFANKIYILETDEGTKASEIKGMPDLGKLFTDNKYDLNTPIADAEIVIINEVDKASSAIRNAMLGVMNEKFLFNGKHKIPCKWKLFVATCNEIPKEEADSPFWDRFMLKMTVNRVSAGELVKYYNKGARNYREHFKIGVPSNTEIESINIPVNKLEKYLEIGYSHSSDRTLTFVPKLAKAVSYVWDISIDKALVKTAQIMINQTAGSELQNKLMSPEVKAVMSKVEMLHSYTTNDQLELAIAEIEGLINTYTSRNIMDEAQVEEIETSMNYLLQNHPARASKSEDFESLLNDLDAVPNAQGAPADII
jgi:MoxR-like ATPase